MFRKILIAFVMLIAVALAWMAVAPPELLRVGANYSAKMICSNVVLSGRDPDEVLEIDVQAPGNPLLKAMHQSISEVDGHTEVRTGFLGFIGKGLAVGMPESGCTVLTSEDQIETVLSAPRFKPAQTELEDTLWPEGPRVEMADNIELDAVLNAPELAGEGMRAIVVVKNGRIVAERYGDGFDADTRLLGWSMAKTVTATLVGAAIKNGLIQLDDKLEFDGWADDERAAIRLSDLMGMASDLQWNEGYGSVSDVTRMLFLEPQMASFVAQSPIDVESPEPTGDIFEYSSGTTVLISQHLQAAFDTIEEAVAFPTKALFEPLRMTSAIFEQDVAGTYVGSSYIYATPRDWARFGQFLLQRGVWNGRSLLPVGYVDWMREEHPASESKYGRGQLWFTPPREFDERISDLPFDTYWAAGHDGQSIAIVPSENLVVVRMGLTPSSLDYKPGLLVQSIIQALQ